MSIQTLLSELNSSQRVAAELPKQHAMVMAGAGCGKTKTIVARAAWLISQTTPADRLQILTFTRRASAEIVERVRTHLGDAAVGLHASTFHTWCLSLMRRAPKLFGYRSFTVLDEDDQRSLFKLFRGKDPPKHFPAADKLQSLYSFARNTCQSLEAVLESEHPELVKQLDEIAKVMLDYEKRKRDRKYLDYDDILDVVAQRIATSPEVRQWVGSLYDHILVDEVQDTNPLQWKLLTPLQDSVTLFCVGDDAQSIYAFRGADFWSVHSFSERVSKSITLKLEKNYRSTQEILDVSNWLIAKSPLNYDKTLIANRGSGQKPQLHTFSNEYEEGRWIAEDILERQREGASWRDHMILVRTVWAGSKVQPALLAKKIPYQVIGGAKLFESAHIRDVLYVLRIVANSEDEIAWMRFLALWPGVGEVTATKLTDELISVGELDHCVKTLAANPKVSPEAAEIIATVRDLQTDVARAFRTASEKLDPILARMYQPDWDKRQLDFALVEGLAAEHGAISDFLEQYVLDPVWGTSVLKNVNDDLVTIITVHSAKGMERETCYVINLNPGAYPLTKALGDFDSVEEERRVLYVALTRAKDALIVTRNVNSQWIPETPEEDEFSPAVETYFFNNLPPDLFDQHIEQHVSYHSNPDSEEAKNPPQVGIAIRSTAGDRTVPMEDAKEKCYMLKRDGVQHGPVSLIQLEMSRRLKRLKSSDIISKVGSDEWIPASQMFKLADDKNEKH